MSKAGVVLTGGGARAAYQVGVLRAIADMYPDWSYPFSVIIGTSAGAINAMALAGNRGLFRHNIDHLEKMWSELTMDRVFRADTISLMRSFSNVARKMISQPVGGGPVSFLDNAPLRQMLELEIDFQSIRNTIREGHIDAVGLNACGYASGQNICFFEGADGLEGWSVGQRGGARTELTIDHIMASSAIPTLFSPVKINREFFGDGVTRQMAHISPVLRLGARKVLVIGVSANAMCPSKRPEKPGMPTLTQVLAQVFNGMFLDTLDYDIDRSRVINQLLELIPEERLKESGLDLSPVDILEISPSEPINDLAMKYIDAMPLVLRRLTGASDSAPVSSANLASFLLFDKRFCRDLIELGYRDGQSHARQIERFFAKEA
ncbi:patatin-like phospholipase family protein [Marinobacter panjinensis]|uniref:Patatin-like phospholipase family protein n=1 Tax=Marinobacter panjinensis TaxID=2576384 RepID=A0A4U6R7B9_9GAMM|nr:patatin-like phospholipase family protein [Marinobacter panjinensis]MCR8914346.1 patatin-like phospholipase family protein [Marinobacter panjinensis]TKV68812.1 patatin-like phospholipase family protein [Marinobacter panjinensis]